MTALFRAFFDALLNFLGKQAKAPTRGVDAVVNMRAKRALRRRLREQSGDGVSGGDHTDGA